MDWTEYSEQNRRAWNEIAQVRSQSYHEATHDAGFFHAGGSILDPRVIEAAGAVDGVRLLHLMCATGEETMSWSVQGSTAIGVDISDRQIAIAEAKAAKAGLQTQFVAADVGDLPIQLLHGDFDLVYSGTGVLVWIPDLSVWAEALRKALRPGGRFILWEEHPVAGCLIGEGSTLRIAWDYFDKTIEADVGWGHFDGSDDASELKYEFGWTLGDLITSIAKAGLIVERLSEYPSEEAWRFGDTLNDAKRLPGRFLLVARKP